MIHILRERHVEVKLEKQFFLNIYILTVTSSPQAYDRCKKEIDYIVCSVPSSHLRSNLSLHHILPRTITQRLYWTLVSCDLSKFNYFITTLERTYC